MDLANPSQHGHERTGSISTRQHMQAVTVHLIYKPQLTNSIITATSDITTITTKPIVIKHATTAQPHDLSNSIRHDYQRISCSIARNGCADMHYANIPSVRQIHSDDIVITPEHIKRLQSYNTSLVIPPSGMPIIASASGSH